MTDQVKNITDNSFILDELSKGNERAFEFIFREYYQSLSQFSYSIVKDQVVAESIVQDVLVKLWERRGTIENISNIFSYLVSMVRNQCIDYIRKEKSKIAMYSRLKIEESDNTTEDQVTANEFEEKLLNAIAHLPERCRLAMEMSRFDGFSNKEIAQKMQISVKGVEALIGRSLKLLRVELKDFLPELNLEKSSGKATILFSLLLVKLRGLKILSSNR